LIAEAVRRDGITELYVPQENVKEAALVPGISVYGYTNLKDLVMHLEVKLNKSGNGMRTKLLPAIETEIKYDDVSITNDFSLVRGQESAKRGLLIAAVGGHNIAMYGPPGTGKTMLARAFTALLPNLQKEHVLEVTGIYSIVNSLENNLVTRPPFRSPHHTASYVSIIGGGANIRPGEVTLAHRGVLFLDEFPEFDKRVIESLRQPLEDGVVTVSRAKGTATFPSNFILIAAMNPCPCGYAGTRVRACSCSPLDIARYQRKLSGPIVDRIDMWVAVESVDYDKLSLPNNLELENPKLKEKIKNARNLAQERFRHVGALYSSNSELGVKDLEVLAPLSDSVRNILNSSAEKLQLSPRAYHRIIRLARTIADIENSADIKEEHILEALQYRPKFGK
jgi:magnesium chelatase family protein